MLGDVLQEKGLKTIGDTISMQVEPWFSHEVGKDFLKWENGGEYDYYDLGKSVNDIYFICMI